MSEPKICSICHLEMGSLDSFAHDDCKLCIYCQHEVGLTVLTKLVKDEDSQTSVKIQVYHQPCRDKALEADFKKKPVIVTQEHLDMLNRSHLFMTQMLTGNDEVTIETNQDIMDKMVISNIPVWFDEMDLDGKFHFLKMAEAIAIRMGIALSKDKNAIQTRIQERELKRFKEVKDYREGQETRKAEGRMRSLTEIEKSNEKADPQLKARRKAIEGFMKIGMDETAATRMVDGAGKPN